MWPRPGSVVSDAYDGSVRVIGFVPPSVGPGGFYVATGRSRAAAFAALNAGTLFGALLIGAGVEPRCCWYTSMAKP